MGTQWKSTVYRHGSSRMSLATAIIVAVSFAGIAHASAAQERNSQQTKDSGNFSAGISIGKDATAKDVGLPWYPGARLHKDKDDDSASVKMGLWGGSSSFKLAVLKLESTDPPSKVREFYLKPLAKYGHVLTCPQSSAAAKPGKSGSGDLTCDSDNSQKNEMVLKAGTKHDQHLVGITPNGAGSLIDLVYLQIPKSVD